MGDESELEPDTFHDALHPLFVTSPAVTHQMINDFLQQGADAIDNFEDYGDVHAFSLQRTKADAAREMKRVKEQGLPMRGTRPPVGESIQLDFKGTTIDELAHYVLQTFAAEDVKREGHDYVTIGWEERFNKNKGRARLDDAWFVIMDEVSAQDRTVVFVHIPHQSALKLGTENEWRHTRNWTKREDYFDGKNWEDDEDEGELKAARVPFDSGYLIDQYAMGEGGLEEWTEGWNEPVEEGHEGVEGSEEKSP